MTGFSRLSRFGMTYKPLTENRGEELLTSYLAAFHAKTSAQQDGGQALTVSEAECGEKWRASFTKFDPRYAFVENSPMLTSRGLGRVLGDLASMGFDARWGVLGAADVGAKHQEGQNLDCRQMEWTAFTHPTRQDWTVGATAGKALKKRQETWPTPDANCGKRGSQSDWTPTRKSGQHAQYTINQAVRDRQM
jgi:hypothetical protein